MGPREYRERCLHRSAIRQAAGGPMLVIGPYNMGVEEFRPRRGHYGEERKSVKKNAALLRFLAFLLLDLIFGVPRGE